MEKDKAGMVGLLGLYVLKTVVLLVCVCIIGEWEMIVYATSTVNSMMYLSRLIRIAQGLIRN
jgi:predicted tellurium resistance membrane protein TerC